MRLRSDLLCVLSAACEDGGLRGMDLEWSDETALTVVMAARGYPGAYDKGSEIRGLEDVSRLAGVQVFHAGTERAGGRLIAAGGRVLSVTALGESVSAAQARAYEAAARIDWPEGFYRRDIGWRDVAREAGNESNDG